MKRLLGCALVLLLSGCGGGTQRGSSPPAQLAPQSAAVSITIDTRAPAQRARKYISPNAKSVAITVTPGNPAFTQASGCANIVSGVSLYTVSVNAPIGSDTFAIGAYDGPCANSTGGSNGSGNLLDTIASIVGTVTAGAANTLNPAGVAPAQPCPGGSCTIVIAQTINPAASAATVSASLSSGTPSLTTFEFDPGVTMALPVSFTLKDNGGNALTSPDANGQTIPLLQPVTVAMTDTSPNAAASNLGLAVVDGNGNVYCPTLPPPGSGTVTFAANATPTCAGNRTTAGTVFVGNPQPTVNFQISNAPHAGDRIVVVYNGATQSTFQSANLAINFGAGSIVTVPIAGQTQVFTQFAGPASPVGIAVAPIGSVEFVSAATKVYAQVAGTALGAGSNAIAGANFTGISYLSAAAPATYVVDPNCINCDATHVGIYQTGATPGTVNGATPTQLTTTGGLTTNGFVQAVIPPFQKGPIAVVALAPGQYGAGGFGSLLVAANNAIYRLDLASATTISAITILAGSGIPGIVGQGSADNANGLNATFNLGTVPFAGMALDATATNLFFSDPGNSAVRKIALAGTNAVTTYARFPSPPGGVAVDSLTGTVFATLPAGNSIQRIPGAGATPVTFAGGNVGTQDGLGSQAYPLQFNVGNAVANGAGTGPQTAYGVLYNGTATVLIGANTNRAQQNAAGINSFVAQFSTPQGLALDPGTNPNGRFYVVDQGSGLIRTAL
ncbi:MAG: hypothetical protein JO140_02530 [Candidatus Eremiobacteraeota bacterium]|nr:hypothetical protein [Candidatus Eremiobacteraeota bacterium]